MKITWLGHGSFRMEIAGQVLLIDPWLTGNPMLPQDRADDAVAGATQLILTHAHFDHSADMVPLAKRLNVPVVGQYDVASFWAESEGIDSIGFNCGGTVHLGDVALTMVPACHSSTFGSPEGPKAGGREVGYIIRGEGRTIYFSGDTSIMADMEWIGDYFKPDIGVICAGGHFTMDMAQAAYAARRYFDFKTLIPMHYKTFPILEQSAQALVDALPAVDVIEPEVMVPIEL